MELPFLKSDQTQPNNNDNRNNIEFVLSMLPAEPYWPIHGGDLSLFFESQFSFNRTQRHGQVNNFLSA